MKEAAVGRQEQTPFPSKEQADALHHLDERIAAAKAALDKQTPELDAAQAEWEKTARAAPPKGTPADVTAALAVDPDKRTPQQKQAVSAYFRTVAPQLGDARDQVAKLTEEKKRLTAKIPTTLVTTAVAPRTVRLLPRGNWQDDSGEIGSRPCPRSWRHRPLPTLPQLRGRAGWRSAGRRGSTWRGGSSRATTR